MKLCTHSDVGVADVDALLSAAAAAGRLRASEPPPSPFVVTPTPPASVVARAGARAVTLVCCAATTRMLPLSRGMHWDCLPFQQLSSDNCCSHPGVHVVLDFRGVASMAPLDHSTIQWSRHSHASSVPGSLYWDSLPFQHVQFPQVLQRTSRREVVLDFSRAPHTCIRVPSADYPPCQRRMTGRMIGSRSVPKVSAMTGRMTGSHSPSPSPRQSFSPLILAVIS